MILKIDSKYQIINDSRQYILQEKRKVKDEDGTIKIDCDGNIEMNYINKGCYSFLINALKAYMEKQIKESDASAVNELIDLIKEVDKKIENSLGGYDYGPKTNDRAN